MYINTRLLRNFVNPSEVQKISVAFTICATSSQLAACVVPCAFRYPNGLSWSSQTLCGILPDLSVLDSVLDEIGKSSSIGRWSPSPPRLRSWFVFEALYDSLCTALLQTKRLSLSSSERSPATETKVNGSTFGGTVADLANLTFPIGFHCKVRYVSLWLLSKII